MLNRFSNVQTTATESVAGPHLLRVLDEAPEMLGDELSDCGGHQSGFRAAAPPGLCGDVSGQGYAYYRLDQFESLKRIMPLGGLSIGMVPMCLVVGRHALKENSVQHLLAQLGRPIEDLCIAHEIGESARCQLEGLRTRAAGVVVKE